MARQDEGYAALDGKRRDSYPDLVFRAPRLNAPTYRELAADHPLYLMAAWAYHHKRELPDPLRRGFMVALERSWPRSQGDYPEVDKRIQAWRAHRKGATIEQLAESFAVQPDTVRRWIKSAAADATKAISTSLFGTDAWSVEVLPGTGAGEPPDPGIHELGALLTPGPLERERRRDASQRALTALNG
jgi:hypothetical protein